MSKKAKCNVLNIRLDCYHHFLDDDNNLLFDFEEFLNEVSQEEIQTSCQKTSFTQDKKHFCQSRRN